MREALKRFGPAALTFVGAVFVAWSCSLYVHTRQVAAAAGETLFEARKYCRPAAEIAVDVDSVRAWLEGRFGAVGEGRERREAP